MKKHKILYSSYSQIPSNTANSIAVIKQCAALNELADLKIILVRGKIKTDYKEVYNVPSLNIKLLPNMSTKYYSLGLRIYVTLYALIYKPDIVYSRDVFINKTLNRFHIPNYYEIHQIDLNDNDFDKKYKKVLKSVSKNPYTKKIICIAQTLKKECIDFGIPEYKIKVLHSGVDLTENHQSKENLIEKPNFKYNKPLVVYTGSTMSGKGTEIITEMSRLTKDYNFLIIGGNKGDIQEQDNLQHIPWVSQSLINQYLDMADFLIMPTVLQKYKFHSPLKLFEYLAAEKVIIASDIDCVKEIITHGKNGILAQAGNPHSFLEQMDSIKKDQSFAKKLKENARISILDYSWQNRAKKIISYIDEDTE